MQKHPLQAISFKLKASPGVTLIDVIVGIALFAIVFLGIYGAFQLSTTFVGSNRVRAGAIALSNERMEYIRALSYENVGTVNGIPSGGIPQSETVSLNGVDYTRRVFISYADDPKDGSGAADSNGITTDYKVAKVEVSWQFRGTIRKASLVSTIVPPGIETTTPGGTLVINALSALGTPLQGASVSLVNASVTPAVNVSTFTNVEGKATFPGAPAGVGYKITVTKEGHSTAKTYDATGANPNPSPGHLSVSLNQTTSSSFLIDILGGDTVRTYLIGGAGLWPDSFANSSLVASSSNVVVGGGEVISSGGAGAYEATGDFLSATITPAALLSWGEARFTKQTNASTTALVRLYYAAGGGQVLVPDTDLSGNAAGFASSPISLAALSTSTYASLFLRGYLSTIDANETPHLLDWEVSYTAGATPLPSISFAVRGDKLIGTTGSGDPIYKFSASYQTDAAGFVNVSSLEWDNYTHTITTPGYDVAESCNPQPVSLNPGAAVTTDIILAPDTAHSLLIAVRSSAGVLLSGATARLYKSGFDQTKTSSSCGQAFWSALSAGTYSLDVSLAGYQPTTVNNVDVSGDTTLPVSFP